MVYVVCVICVVNCLRLKTKLGSASKRFQASIWTPVSPQDWPSAGHSHWSQKSTLLHAIHTLFSQTVMQWPKQKCTTLRSARNTIQAINVDRFNILIDWPSSILNSLHNVLYIYLSNKLKCRCPTKSEVQEMWIQALMLKDSINVDRFNKWWQIQ